MNKTDDKDDFEQKLELEIIKLKDCQQKMNLKSCMQCGKFLECKIRASYIKSVYQSMNKGKSGGFEF